MEWLRSWVEISTPAGEVKSIFEEDNFAGDGVFFRLESGQVTHFNIPGISRRAGLHFLADGFAFFAVGAHEFVVELEVHPLAGGVAEKGGC